MSPIVNPSKRVILTVLQTRTIPGRRFFSGLLEYADARPDWEIVSVEPWERFNSRQLLQARNNGVDGIIITLPGTSDAMKALADSDIPTVYVNIPNIRLPANRRQVSFLYTDNEDIGRKGGEYFLSVGRFNSYGFIGTPSCEFWSDERERAFRAIVSPHGKYFRFKGQSLIEWIKRLPRPAAIMTASDDVAVSALNACKALSLSTPQQVSILGVNNTPTADARNTLSSIVTDMRQLGYSSGEEMSRILLGGKRCRPNEITIAAGELIIRKSTSNVVAAAKLVADIKTVIAKNYMHDISISDIIAKLKCSRRLAELRFRQVEGCSIHHAIEELRLSKATELLRDPNITVTKAACLSGLKSVEKLSHLFHKRKGMSIRKWRKVIDHGR